MNVLLLHWDTKPDKRIRRTFQRPATTRRMSRPGFCGDSEPCEGGRSGHAVLSIHALDDIIVYGLDLVDYIDQEFRSPKITVSFWSAYL
jgi:hypothetical protein